MTVTACESQHRILKTIVFDNTSLIHILVRLQMNDNHANGQDDDNIKFK